MTKWILSLTFVLSSVTAFAQGHTDHNEDRRKPRPSPQQPAPARVELRDIIKAVGYDYRDCDYRLQGQAAAAERELLRSCERQSGNRCFVSTRRHLGGGYVYAIAGSHKIDDYKIDARTCRERAAQRAEQDAVSRCQNEYGVRCYVTRRGVSDHREERRRRYGIMGPKENFQVCRGNSEAAPESRYREQCSMEIRVTNR